ncbi:sulfatase-like hydrolase/transferase [Dyadobacter sp. 676]|uniref:Sulfatase-like hydrolase/transferase n=1 Tax=Dyadobacter sp. 676 TaxID=3088362 RepID=A0AAU8FNH0_9BACT
MKTPTFGKNHSPLQERMFKTSLFLAALGLVTSAGLAALKTRDHSESPENASRPNIVVILADDMGYSDMGCYGGEVKTPNLDYLALNGLRYRQFYNTSRCCPTRASLLTGLYSHQAGIGKMTEAENQPGYQGHITENTVTLAEVLKTAGYQTGMVGKWHVSNTFTREDPQEQLAWLSHQKDFGAFSPVEQYPASRGFDKFFGTIWGGGGFFRPVQPGKREGARERSTERLLPHRRHQRHNRGLYPRICPIGQTVFPLCGP